MEELKTKVEKVRDEARYMADPRDGVTANASAMLEMLTFVQELAGGVAAMAEQVQALEDQVAALTPAPAPAEAPAA